MARTETAVRITRRAERVGLDLPPALAKQAASYFDLLFRWNETVNLTALANGEEAVDRLVVEPLVAARHLPDTGVLLDVGSGGGSPAVPLKLAHPGLRLVMVESKTRKAAFLREVIRQVGMESASVEASRLEELVSRPDLHRVADVVSVRAVRVDRRLLQRLRAFMRPGGEVALFAGPGAGGPPVEAPWEFAGERPLVPALGSRLVLLRLNESVMDP